MSALKRLHRSLLAIGRRITSPDYLRLQVERSWSKEARALQWFGLRDGMSVFDLGCGPGYFARRLVDWLPNIQLMALDSDANMLSHARAQLGDRASVVQARVDNTGIQEHSFDFVLARLVFQHLREPLAVATEARRLLKPGGRFVVTDIDDDLFGIVEPSVPGFTKLLARYGEAQAARGGNRRVGRTLLRLLREAGFDELELDCIAVNSDESGIDACFPQLDPAPLSALAAAGHLSNSEYAELRTARKKFDAAADRFALVLLFMACGTKRV